MTNATKLHFGEFIEGGYYAGTINLNGEHVGIVVAAKADGETSLRWGEPGNDINAKSCFDGAANTAAMAQHNSELAQWARQLNINGYSDWYIPSRDELELCYRNLKPTDEKNWCSYRDGENPNSVPPGLFYSDDDPAQTTAPNFKHGAAEHFDDAWYWSSTQCSANTAFVQVFADGGQNGDHKSNTSRARAVRRFKIIN